MLDFLMVSTRSTKRGVEIYPKFIVKKSKDLMIRGGDFYAIWVEERGLWSTDESDVIHLIDRELDQYAKEHSDIFESEVRVLHMWDAESGMIDRWHKYCQSQMRDNYHTLDENLIFSNTPTKKEDYASRKLSYPLQEGDLDAYERLMSVLYSETERHKIEWAIGAIVTGDSKQLQKFMVLYGSAGTGKSTVLNIIGQLFEGYCATFNAKSLGSSTDSFALEAFKSNPLVAIEHDAKLSRIEDNTRINSLVSHEEMMVNEKHKSLYSSRFKCFLILGTNEPVKITDAKSGLIRRLIDVSPTGNKLSVDEYTRVTEQIKFELGAIACHCRDVYRANPHAYDNYIPIAMLEASNDFYNFVTDSYHVFRKEDGVSLKAAWEMYKAYCEEARVSRPYPKRIFAEELKNYFRECKERHTTEDGSRLRKYYAGFRTDKFDGYTSESLDKSEKSTMENWLYFDKTNSLLDKLYAGCPAQYASDKETPLQKWENVTTRLCDLDTTRLHYVRVPDIHHIFIDFDLKDENRQKSFEKNLEAASRWPKTYAELSKSGVAIHLHYIYTGDPELLEPLYADQIEVKVLRGNSSLRRKLTKCNDIPVATITSGLPLKGEKMVNFNAVMSEKGLRALIERNLRKEIHPGTKPSIDFIDKILNEAKESGMSYDVTDLRNAVLAFAVRSTNNSEYCVKLVSEMPFHSDDISEGVKNEDATLVFYDVEVFPNLFLVSYKAAGKEKSVARLINPTPSQIEELMHFRLVGFNCRRYDNHILYARLMGYTNEQLYALSQRIVSGEKGAFFGEAYNVSYTDVYDFSSNKQSLKKFEIDLGIHHQELGLPWDKPVPEEMWEKVAEYCANDVIATEAVFNARQADFTARQILADVAGMSVNDTTNSLTTRIIFGGNRKPQDVFNYRDMGYEHDIPLRRDDLVKGSYTDSAGQKVEVEWPIDGDFAHFDPSNHPYFPGYKYENGKSTYRGEEVGEGGYVYAEPGIYGNVALLDVASMHPSSAIAEELFGPEYTRRYKDILDARLAIKHKDFDKAKTMLGGALAKYLNDEKSAKALAQALKIAINSVYGLTRASFENPFRDIRNVDNIVAKRGALFMINLKHEVQKRGFTVAHIKTDSIKIPDATSEIISFVTAYGKLYGYTFEHEATYERMCLVNDAVYIAKYDNAENCEKRYGYIPGDNRDFPGKWTATGTQFAVPYVFKTLFSREEITFDDMCETKSVTKGALYLDMNERLPEDEHSYHFIGRVGLFCPMKPGAGGGILLREKDGKYYAVSGTKGYRWMESEMVKVLDKESEIDISYYERLVEEAKGAISKYGDFDLFVSDTPYEQWPPEDDLPF